MNTILAELATESARLMERKKCLPKEYDYLFKDWLQLIAGTEELEPIVQARIKDDQQRQAQASNVQAEAKAIANELDQQAVEKPQEIANEATENVALSDFVITIRLSQVSQQQAVDLARKLKAEIDGVVSLNKAK